MESMTLEQTAQQQTYRNDEQFVIQQVLGRLGTPKGLYRVNAQKVGKSQFRVNVYCCVDSDRPVNTVNMSDSFFITLTGDKIECQPEIRRKY